MASGRQQPDGPGGARASRRRRAQQALREGVGSGVLRMSLDTTPFNLMATGLFSLRCPLSFVWYTHLHQGSRHKRGRALFQKKCASCSRCICGMRPVSKHITEGHTHTARTLPATVWCQRSSRRGYCSDAAIDEHLPRGRTRVRVLLVSVVLAQRLRPIPQRIARA